MPVLKPVSCLWHGTTRQLTVLVVAALVLASPARLFAQTPAPNSPAGPALSLRPSVLQVSYPDSSGRGRVAVTNISEPLSALSLEAQALVSGVNVASVRFPQNGGKNYITLDTEALSCKATQTCWVSYEVSGIRAEGTYSGALNLYSGATVAASASLSVLRPAAVFEPVISGESLKNGHIELDATEANSFVLTVENPTGAPWRKFRLSDCAGTVEYSCDTPQGGQDGTEVRRQVGMSQVGKSQVGMSYSPAVFLLGPGKSQSVIARVLSPAGAREGTRFLQITDADEPSLQKSVLVVVKKLASGRVRVFCLFLFVLLGALVSVLLNNVVPASTAKSERFAALARIDDVVSGCSLIDPALRDVLSAELGRIRLVVRGVRFYQTRKDSVLEDTRGDIASLLSIAVVARSVSGLRAQVQSKSRSLRVKLEAERILQDVESNLIAFDVVSAGLRLGDATRLLATAEQEVTLAADLKKDIQTLLVGRGNESGVSADALPRAPDVVSASESAAVARGRVASIAHLLGELELAISSLPSLGLGDLLDMERALYIAQMWTEIVEPALERDKARFESVSQKLLECLRRNPAAEHVQLTLALIRSSLTPEDIGVALQSKAGAIESSHLSGYLEPADFAFVFADPCIQAVSAARRLVSYEWGFTDGSEPPEDFERCRHYFVPPPLRLRRKWPWLGRDLRVTHTVSVNLSVPGAPASAPTKFERTITLHARNKYPSGLGMLQMLSFGLSTAVAVLAAFAAQYGTAIPETTDWRVLLAAFMFGFGIDQIRDKTTVGSAPSSSVATVPPAATPSPAPQAAPSAQPQGAHA